MNVQTYSSKSTAIRGAKRSNLDLTQFELVEVEGRFMFKAIEQAPKQPRVKAPKIPLLRKSEMTGVCAYIWDVCDELLQDACDEGTKFSRNEVLARCVADGCAFYTARTQFQHWYSLNKATIVEALAESAKGNRDDEDDDGDDDDRSIVTKRPIAKKAPVRH